MSRRRGWVVVSGAAGGFLERPNGCWSNNWQAVSEFLVYKIQIVGQTVSTMSAMDEHTCAISCTGGDESITEAKDALAGEMAVVNYKFFVIRSHIRFIFFVSNVNWHCGHRLSRRTFGTVSRVIYHLRDLWVHPHFPKPFPIPLLPLAYPAKPFD